MVPKIRNTHTPSHKAVGLPRSPPSSEAGSTWAGPPVPRRRARAGAPLLGFWGIDVGVAAQHNNTTKTHLAVVGRFCVRAVRRVACVPKLCRSTPPYPSHSTREAGRAAPADPALPRTLLKAHLALHRHLLYTTHSLLPRLTQPVKPTSLFTYSFHSSSSFRLTTIHSAHLLRPRLFSLTCTSLDAKVFRNLAPLSVHG